MTHPSPLAPGSEPDTLLTTAEAASVLRLKPSTLEHHRMLRTGPPYVKHAGRVLYRRSALWAWIASHESVNGVPPKQVTGTVDSPVTKLGRKQRR